MKRMTGYWLFAVLVTGFSFVFLTGDSVKVASREVVSIPNYEMPMLVGDIFLPEVWQREFAEELFWPMMEHIASRYPVESLREQFQKVLERHRTGEVPIVLRYKQYGTVNAMFIWRWPQDGMPEEQTFRFYVTQLMIMYSHIGSEAFMHQLLVTTLHEEFHRMHRFEDADRSVREIESRAWWGDCEYTLQVMEEHGLEVKKMFVKGALKAEAYYAYKASRGDRNAPEWQQFMDRVAPE